MPIFRARKRPKHARKRTTEDDEPQTIAEETYLSPPAQSPTEAHTPQSSADNAASPEPQDENFSMAEILRRRNQLKRRRGGLQFSSSSHNAERRSSTGASDALVPVPVDAGQAVFAKSFVPQTGKTVDVEDKEM